MIKWLESSGATPPNPHVEQKRKDEKMRNNNKTNHTNVTLNSTSRGCKAEPYPFSASAVIQSLFKFNKLGYGNACQGLRHWRLLSNLKNNFLKPVRNDMDNKNRPDCFAFARNDEIVEFEDNKILKQSWIIGGSAGSTQPSPGRASLLPKSAVQNDNTALVQNNAKDKNGNELINLSTYRLINFKKKSAFTLAEVLITLGIIGVVAAMTIPTLMTKIQSAKLKSEYKEAYATIAQAVKMYNSDDDRISLQGKGNGYRSFMKYFTGATDCGNTTQVADDSEYCFVRQSNVDGSAGTITNKDYQYKNYSKKSLFISTYYLDDGQFYLQKNNMLIAFNINTVDSPNPFISVDINGKKNKPNAWGHDVFTFELVQNEKEGGYELLPQGAIGTTLEKARNILCDKNSKDTRNGVTCSYFAQNNPTYFDNLPK